MEILCKPLQFFTLQMKIKQQSSLLPGFPQHISSFSGLAQSLYQPRCPGMRQQCEDSVPHPKAIPFHSRGMPETSILGTSAGDLPNLAG